MILFEIVCENSRQIYLGRWKIPLIFGEQWNKILWKHFLTFLQNF